MAIRAAPDQTDAVSTSPRTVVTLVAALVVAVACTTTAPSTEPRALLDAGPTTSDAGPVDASTTAPAPATAAPAPSSSPSSASSTAAPATAAPSTASPSTSSSTAAPSTAAPAATFPALPSDPTTTVPPELNPCPPRGDPKFKVRPPVAWELPEIPDGWTQRSIGRSAQGREIIALVRPAVAEQQHQVIVIGSIHGNEVTSVPTVSTMVTVDVPDDVELWLIPDANPDGTAIGTRCNANGVDLNRNFDWEWDPVDGGPGPMSEPETQALASLILREWPDLVVWVHQPLRYIAAIGPTDPVHARAWAQAARLPFRDDITQHGGAESWTAFVAGRPSILLEVEERDLSEQLVDAHVAGLAAALAAFP